MKKTFTLLLLLAGWGTASAQQDPQFSQTGRLRPAFNPAAAGAGPGICATLGHRQQWTGFTNHPVTTVFTANAPVPDAHGGVGLTIFDDRLGQESTLQVSGAYAYRMMVGHNQFLSGGVSLGFIQKALRAGWNIPDDQIQIDNTIPDNGVADAALDAAVGLYYRSSRSYAGLSVSHAHRPTASLEVGKKVIDFQLLRHIYVHGGHEFVVNGRSLLTSFWYRSDGREPQLETTIKTPIVPGFMQAGLSYRHNDAIVPIAEFFRQINGINWFLGYSYDFTLNPLRATSFGSHELQLGACFVIPKKIKKWKNPQNLGPYNYF